MQATTLIESIDGFLQKCVQTYEDFRPFATYFANDLGFVFRGHAQSTWTLETSLDRLIRRIRPQVDLDSTYDFQLELFKKSIRGRTSIAKAIGSEKDELWALGQHYGLATPLLDWSTSLYVALFFAFNDPSVSPCGHRTVWAMHRNSMISAMQKYNEGREYNHQFSFVSPITDVNARLVSQAGVFTRQPLSFDFLNWTKEQFKGDRQTYLFKIDIADSERLNILGHLRQMNIHSGSLFPDLVGASLDCNEMLELLAEQRRRNIASGLDAPFVPVEIKELLLQMAAQVRGDDKG